MAGPSDRLRQEHALFLEAARQLGLVTRAQAMDTLGVSSSALSRKVSSGLWERIHPEVYRLVGAPESRFQAALAATLWAGPGSVASHRTALCLWGYSSHPTVAIRDRAFACTSARHCSLSTSPRLRERR